MLLLFFKSKNFLPVVKRAKSIVYTTKSNCSAYNEKIVTKQLEVYNEIATTKNLLRYGFVSTIPHSKFDYFTAVIEQEVLYVYIY